MSILPQNIVPAFGHPKIKTSFHQVFQPPSSKLTLSTDLKILRQTQSTTFPTPKNKSGLHINNFTLLRLLGRGKFGSVYLAVHKQTGFIFAIKVIRKGIFREMRKQESQKILNQLIRQTKIQMFLEHPNIIELYSFFSDSLNIYLLMELACGGQLYQLMSHHRRLSEEAISFLIRETLKGAKYMHSHRVIHRDIKPQNIVLQHGVPKICDFGWAVHCPQQFRSTLCGTPLYLSPEILKGDSYNEKIDAWAIGTLTYELFTGRNPFNICKKQEMIKIVTDQIQIREGSANLKSFIEWALTKNPHDRPKSFQLLQHRFIDRYKELETCEEICEPMRRCSYMRDSWKQN